MKTAIRFTSLLLVLSMLAPTMSFAETATSTDVIAQLKQKILELQAQILELQKQQQQVTLELLKNLQQGSTGDDVKTLQTLLAGDSDVYPEGKITGFFGPLTAKALKRFQAKHGIEQLGFAGPKTLKKLNELLKGSTVVVVGDTQSLTASTTCTVLPPGHYIAPGWNKKMERENDDDDDDDNSKNKNKDNGKGLKLGTIPFSVPCSQLPPGIAKKIGQGTTTPPVVDTIAPIILSTSVSDIGTTSARINWVTNEMTRAQVAYGTSTSYTTETGWSAGVNTVHSHLIAGLSANTVYHFRISVKDMAGNMASTSDMTFTTVSVTPPTDTTAPTISNVAVGSITQTSATITWTTSESTQAKMAYGTTTPYAVETGFSSSFSSGFTQVLSGLTASTTYHFSITAKDAAGNMASTSDMTFTTAAVPPADTTPPVISSISAGSIASTTANVTWTTNELATSKVYYGTTTPLSLSGASFLADSSLVTSHTKSLSGLMASTTHYYVIESQDGVGNIATSTENSFTTLP